jgi:LysR family glycine cleavage system transcriptional activator
VDRLPPLSAVRVFEAAGRLENFSRAAEELGMTQAAVSYQIRQLEDRVGRPLFVRDKGRVRLSDAGRRLLPALSSALTGIAEAFSAVRAEDEDVLSINTFATVGSNLLSGRVGRFQLRYPDLAMRISVDENAIDFGLGGTDVAIRGGDGLWPGLRADFLMRQHYAPICSPAFLEHHAITRPEDLLEVERLAPNDSLWARWFAGLGIETPPPRQGLELDSQVQEAGTVLSGFGIAMMTPLFWRAELESGRLVQPFADLLLHPSSLWLVHPEGRAGVRKIERFREWLQAELAAERGWSPEAVWERP